MTQRLAYSIDELMGATGIGRTRIYEEIKSGRLKAAKCGKRTIVTADAAREWLESLNPATA